MNNERYKRPDKKNAQSLVDVAKQEMGYALTIQVNEKSAATIIRNIYECFRMLGNALLVYRGIESEDHVAPIQALLKLKILSLRPMALIDNYRILRHNLNYYGYRPKIEEARDIIDFAEKCFEPAMNEVITEISK